MQIFVCQTVFHLLVATLEAMRQPNKQYVLLVADTLRLDYSVINSYFESIIEYPKSSIDEEWIEFRKKKPFHIHCYKSKIKELVEEKCGQVLDWQIFNNQDLIVFNDGAPFVVYLMLFAQTKSIALYEDGEAIYSHIKKDIKYWAKVFWRYPVLLGNSKYVSSVVVRYPERLPKGIRKKSRCLKLNRLMDSLSDKQKGELFTLFELDLQSVALANNSLLLITQPLSEDDIVSEEYKLDLYEKIIASSKFEHVFIKPHPREKSDYSKIADNVIILPNTPPVELFELSKIHFKQAVTLFSSAIHSVPADEKVFLGVDFDKQVEMAWMRNIGIKKVVKS